MPMAVTIAGGLHGILFIAYVILAREVKTAYKKDMNWLWKAGLASILPFGTFYMDKYWKKEESEVAGT